MLRARLGQAVYGFFKNDGKAELTRNCLSASGSRAHAWSSYLDAPEGRQALSSGSLPDGISLRGTRPQLTFWPVARAASNGTLTICDELEIAASLAIVISQSGRARLERLNDATCGA